MAKQNSPDSVALESTSPTNADAKPARSSTERMLVWGGIGLLVVVSAIEGYSQMSFQKTFDGLHTELEQADVGKTQITKARVDTVLNRQPDRTQTVKAAYVGEERYDIYVFKGLLKNRLLCVHYGVAGVKAEPEVIGVSAELPDAML